MSETPPMQSKAAELREAFDRSFAVPPPPASQEVEDLLTIRVAGDPYAIRLRDIAGLVAKRRVVPVPADTPDLLGLAGIRGGIVPVFALASILGYGHTPDSPRWMILCGVEDAIALTFSDFEGYLRLPKRALHGGANSRASGLYLQELASTDRGVLAIINVPLVAATIRNRISHNPPTKE